MNKATKKLLSWVLIATMLLTMLPAAFADEFITDTDNSNVVIVQVINNSNNEGVKSDTIESGNGEETRESTTLTEVSDEYTKEESGNASKKSGAGILDDSNENNAEETGSDTVTAVNAATDVSDEKEESDKETSEETGSDTKTAANAATDVADEKEESDKETSEETDSDTKTAVNAATDGTDADDLNSSDKGIAEETKSEISEGVDEISDETKSSVEECVDEPSNKGTVFESSGAVNEGTEEVDVAVLEDAEEGMYAESVMLLSTAEAPIFLRSATIAGTEDSVPEAESFAFTATVVSTKADVVFVLDSTGSMSDEIYNVKENLNGFTQTLDDSGVNYRIAVLEYKDITEYGEADSTKIVTDGTGKVWFNSAEEVANVLSSIYVDGGGDLPETVVDALGSVLNDLNFRGDASKFAIVVTDADYKDDNNYGLANMSDAISALKEAGINTSVISDAEYESTYHDLYTETDGIFCDINGDFAEELATIAEHIEEVTVPVQLILTTKPGDRNDAEAKYSLEVKVVAVDKEKTATDVALTLSAPENFVVTGSLVQNIAAVAPNQTEIISWNVSVPVLKDDTNYTWSVNAASDDFATGAVISAQDTFQVVGSGERDYSWDFNRDQYNFTNWYDYFGEDGEPYYISDEDLKLIISQIVPTDIDQMADWYARGNNDPTIDHNVLVQRLKDNDLDEWGGSCYGMSLTAALYKVGLLDPSIYSNASGNSAEYTHDIAPITAGTNTPLESMINFYHFSQATDVAVNSSRITPVGEVGFSAVADEMWNKASQIGHEGSVEQPFLVRLRSDRGGHAVVCYGAEEGKWSVGGFLGIGATEYTKKLLIADPNYREGSNTYILFNDDYSKALYFSDHEYNQFGYRNASLSQLNQYDYYDTMANHKIDVAANNATNLILSIGSSKAVIIAGKIVAVDGEVSVSEYRPEDMIAGDGDYKDNGKCRYLFNSNEDVTISPSEEGGSINTLITMGDYSASLNGQADSMTLSQNGTVHVTNASGDFSLNLAINDSAFEFVTIKGTADGEVEVSLRDGKIEVSGDIENYSVENMTRRSSSTNTEVSGAYNTQFVVEKGKVVAYYDTDGDGVYETRADSQSSSVAQVLNYNEGTRKPETKLWILNQEQGDSGLVFERIHEKSELEIFVDGEALTRDIDYSINKGILTLKPEFLNGLAVGFHTIQTSTGYSEAFVVSATKPSVWKLGFVGGLSLTSIPAENDLELTVSDGEQLVNAPLFAYTDFAVNNSVVMLRSEFLNGLQAGFYVVKTTDGDQAEVFQIIK